MTDTGGKLWHIELPPIKLPEALVAGGEIVAQVRAYGQLLAEVQSNTYQNLLRLQTVINGALGPGNVDLAALAAALEIPEDRVVFDPVGGHHHDGVDSRRVLGSNEVVEFAGVRTVTGQLVASGMKCLQVWLKRGASYRLMLPVWIDRLDRTDRRTLGWLPWLVASPALWPLALSGGVRLGTDYGVGRQYPVVEQDGAGGYVVDLGTIRTGRLVAG